MKVIELPALVRSYPVQLSHTLGRWFTFLLRDQNAVGPWLLAPLLFQSILLERLHEDIGGLDFCYKKTWKGF